MRGIALVSIIACGACAPARPVSGTLPELYAKRESASSKRTLGIVGLSLGVVGAVAGGALLAYGGTHVSDDSGNHDDAFAAFLTGLLLFGGSSAVAVGSSIYLGEADRDYTAIDAQIRSLTSSQLFLRERVELLPARE